MQEIEIDEVRSERFYGDNYDDYKLGTIESCDTNYVNFFENFMLKNEPCVIKNISSAWDCTKKWIKNNTINFDYFKQNYGDLVAPVANCDSIVYNAHSKINMKVCDYMQYLEKNEKDKLLYLKDWHLRRLQPNDNFYEVPLVFGSDWLNEFAIDHNEDDFMFVYIGPKDSWTPLHADVYYSYSWSVNIIGRKKWILFPPGEEEKLKDSLGNLPLHFSTEKFEGIKYLEIIQEKGDAIFVPSGWHHEVRNELDTISINHNWINGCNIKSVWEALNSSLLSVEHEIKEFKDTPEFTSQCQLILKSLFGMDFTSFAKFICYIGEKRLAQLQGVEHRYLHDFIIKKNHLIFDLKNILNTINLIINHPLFLNKYLLSSTELNLVNIMHKISNILD